MAKKRDRGGASPQSESRGRGTGEGEGGGGGEAPASEQEPHDAPETGDASKQGPIAAQGEGEGEKPGPRRSKRLRGGGGKGPEVAKGTGRGGKLDSKGVRENKGKGRGAGNGTGKGRGKRGKVGEEKSLKGEEEEEEREGGKEKEREEGKEKEREGGDEKEGEGEEEEKEREGAEEEKEKEKEGVEEEKEKKKEKKGGGEEKEKEKKGGEEEDREGGSSGEAPVILFAHGAGAGKDSPWMLKWRRLLEEGSGASAVIAFDYPFSSEGKKGAPPKAEKLVDFHAAQVEEARNLHPKAPIVLCGKSMGSRVGAMVAATEECGIQGVICFGYPMKGISGASRADTLQAVPCPLLLLQGSKDSLGPLDEIRSAIASMPQGLVDLVVVEGGDHSLDVGVKALTAQNRTQDDVDQECLEAVQRFLKRLNADK